MNIKSIADNHETFIIAEVGQAHDGSLGIAHSYIDAAAECGVNAIKFQTHIAEEESTERDQWRKKFSYKDETRYEYWKRMEFKREEWKQLYNHACEKGIVFISSPFSIKACEILKDIGMNIWKIASGELSNIPLLEHIAQYQDEVIVSNGLTDDGSLESLFKFYKEKNINPYLLQCTSEYPVCPENIHLNKMSNLGKKFDTLYGLSDHSGKIFPSLAATTLGASIIEFHITFSRASFGPDSTSSLELHEVKQLCEGIRYTNKMNVRNKVSTTTMSDYQIKMKRLFEKSIVASRNLYANDTISMSDLAFKKPGTGIKTEKYKSLIGKVLKKNMIRDEEFTNDSFI